MPAIPRRTRLSPDREALVAELAEELSHPTGRHQPRIIRNPLPKLGKTDLVVIWDRWDGLPFPARSDLILEACEGAEEGLSGKIYTAIGRTTEEAISLGFLPFRIAVADHRVPEGDRAKIETALSDLGAAETSEGPQLRFERLDEAQDALLRLGELVPGPYWTILQEVARDD
jgi:hypothetical protein